MNRVILAGKRLAEQVNYVFDFTSQLAIGETITGGTTSVSVFWGVDANPNAIASTRTNGSSTVTQLIVGGVLGVIYTIDVQAATSLGQTILLSGALAIIPDLQ